GYGRTVHRRGRLTALLPLRDGLQTPGGVVPRAVHPRAHRPGAHRLARVGPKERTQILSPGHRPQPPRIVRPVAYHPHPVVVRSDKLVRLRGEDRAALELLPLPLPHFPEPREREEPLVPEREEVRLLLASFRRPLDEPVRRDEAAAAREGGAECRFL